MSKGAKLTIHMVCSLDGFIAKKNGDVSWLQSTDAYPEGVTLSDEYIRDFLKGIDCYLMGSHTYEHALQLGWPYGETPVVVTTSRPLTTDRANVAFYSGDLQALVVGQLKKSYTNIWMAGGAALTKDFLRLQLADRIVVSIMPVILGDGILFFDFIGRQLALHLEDVTAYKDGMVELSYEILKEGSKA